MELTMNYNKIYKVFKLFYIFPVCTIECERIFSQVTDILVKKRNTLKINHLNMLLMISRNGEKIENFDFIKAI